MKKRIWMERFKKELGALSNRECQEALNYYEELYQDRKDAGYSEEEIIADFLSPEEAAKKILEEYGYSREEQKPMKKPKEKRRHPLLWAFLLILLFPVYVGPLAVLFAVTLVVLIVPASLFVAGIAIIGGGILSLFVNGILVGGSLLVGGGTSLITVGIGILLIYLLLKIFPKLRNFFRNIFEKFRSLFRKGA